MDTSDREARVAALLEQMAAVQAGSPGQARSPASVLDEEPVDVESCTGQTAAAKAICLRLLAVAPRPRAGLAQALKRKDIPDHIIEAVLDRLTEVGLIDDAAYAQGFVRTKHRDRALAGQALRAELRKRGVDDSVTADAVGVIDLAAERSRAAELITKRIDAAMADGPVAARRRLLALLDRRGYSAEVAVPVVRQALESYSEGVECGS